VKQVALGECCEVLGGGTPKTAEPSYWDGHIPWVTPKDLSDLGSRYIDKTARNITDSGLDHSGARVLPAGSVLLSSRAPIGLVAMNSVPMATNQGFKSLVPDPAQVDASYLAWWLQTHTAHLQAMGNGATFKEVSKSVVARLQIPLPDLGEQRRIAQGLDAADTLRAKRRRAVEAASALTESIFHERFGALRENPRRLPVARLSDLCRRITDGTHQSPDWATSGHPFLFVKNIISGEIEFQTEKFISDETQRELTRRCPIEVGDVLYSTVGSYGVPAIVRTRRTFAFQRHIAHLKPDPASVHPEYLRAALASPDARAQADRVARGVAQKTLNLGEIERFSLLAPSLADQRAFAQDAEAAERVKATEATHLAHLDALFASLQYRAFASEL